MDNHAKNDVVQEWTIMLIGKSGVGKSSSGNTIIGRPAFQSDMKLARVTQICEKERTEVDGRPVSVIDTPGLFETNRNEKEILREILKRVTLQGPGPHAFVLVVPLGRLTMEDQETNLRIQAAFGPRVWDYTIVLFTYGDRLEGKAINEVIASSDVNLRNFIRRCSGGFLVFDNKNPDSKPEQVSKLLEKIDTLVALNGGGRFSNKLYPPKERRIREKQESILAERDGEIRREERELEDKYKDEELKRRRKELWRREEEASRKEAERQPSEKLFVVISIIIIVVLTAVGYSLSEDHLVYFAGAALGCCILFKDKLAHVVSRSVRK